MSNSYREIYEKKLKKCKSKKDYKRLCKQMLFQFDAIDGVDENQWRILSQIMGEDACAQVLALAIKMYTLEQQGISCDLLSIEDFRYDK